MGRKGPAQRGEVSGLDLARLPAHVAIIMDGNGRWARARGLGRIRGHRVGSESVRAVTREAARLGLERLTLFAFSSENWGRPKEEVTVLMQLFLKALEQEVEKLHGNGIRFKVIGDLSAFDAVIVDHVRRADAGMRAGVLLQIDEHGSFAATRIHDELDAIHRLHVKACWCVD